MKKIALCFCCLCITLFATPSIVAADPANFTVIDLGLSGLGQVTINGATSSTILGVPLPGTYVALVYYQAASITIEGQTVAASSSGPIVLANGEIVKLVWGSNYVEVIDKEGQ